MSSDAPLGLRCGSVGIAEQRQEFCGDCIGAGALAHRLFGKAFNGFDEVGRSSLEHAAPERRRGLSSLGSPERYKAHVVTAKTRKQRGIPRGLT